MLEVSQQDTLSEDHSHSAPDATTVFTILSEVFKQQPPDTVITEKVEVDYKRYLASGLGPHDIGDYNGKPNLPLAADVFSPGNFSPPLELTASLPTSVIQALTEIVNTNPSKILALDALASPTERTKRLEDIAAFLDTQLGVRGLANNQLYDIYKILEKMRYRYTETLYYHRAFFEAGRLITTVAPQLEQWVTPLLDETVILKPTAVFEPPPPMRLHEKIKRKIFNRLAETTDFDPSGVGEKMENWASCYTGNMRMISVNGGEINFSNVEEFYFHVLAFAHELLHLVLGQLLHSTRSSVSFPTEAISHEMYTFKKNLPSGNLARVLTESASIALEYELIRYLQSDPTLSPFTKVVEDCGAYRLQSVRATNRQFYPKNRIDPTSRTGLIIPYEFAQFCYSEGVRLAIALQRNDWKLNDLPELMQIVEEIVLAETNQPNLLLDAVPLAKDRDDERIFLKTRQRVGFLKKRLPQFSGSGREFELLSPELTMLHQRQTGKTLYQRIISKIRNLRKPM